MRVGCDIGGTFTDLIAFDEKTGTVSVGKALNSGHGPAMGVQDALASAGVALDAVTALIHGTTVVTNLLIERTGDPVGLICTRGFRDVLEIQLSFRERTFDARYRKVPPLVPRRFRLEIGGRIDRDGVEIEPLDRDEIAGRLRELHGAGIRCLAVSLYNAYANPAHEQAVAAMWRAMFADANVSCATDVDPRLGEYERVSTVTLNASAVPTMASYVAEMAALIPAPTLYMHSAGGVLPPEEVAERPILLALSGPAGGVLAGQRVLDQLGLENGITLDMGGTSCDVCLIQDGRVREREQFNIAWDVPARVRSLDIGTIGAGGGSIAWRDEGGALRVGPRSAGALPGPACYGRGGADPTVTDANLVLGILPAEGLLDGSLALDADAAETALSALGEQFGVDASDAAAAVHQVVSAAMSAAVRETTVRHGIDPRGAALIAFGGAGPQHGCAVARELGMSQVVIPADSSILSAVGLLTADVRAMAARSVRCSASDLQSPQLVALFGRLEEEAQAHITGDEAALLERWAGLRYVNQWHQVSLPISSDPGELVERFHTEHEQRYGTRLATPVEVVEVWVTAVVSSPTISLDGPSASSTREATSRYLHLAGADVPVHDRRGLGDAVLTGPCLVQEPTTVTVIDAGWSGRLHAGHLLLEAHS